MSKLGKYIGVSLIGYCGWSIMVAIVALIIVKIMDIRENNNKKKEASSND